MWIPPEVDLPPVLMDVDIAYWDKDDKEIQTVIGFLGKDGRWQVACSFVWHLDTVLLWKHRPALPHDIATYIQEFDVSVVLPPPAVGQNTGNSGSGSMPSQSPPSSEVLHPIDAVDSPPQAALEPGHWWCFTTDQIQAALDAWSHTIEKSDIRQLCSSAVRAFLQSPAAAKLRGR